MDVNQGKDWPSYLLIYDRKKFDTKTDELFLELIDVLILLIYLVVFVTRIRRNKKR